MNGPEAAAPSGLPLGGGAPHAGGRDGAGSAPQRGEPAGVETLARLRQRVGECELREQACLILAAYLEPLLGGVDRIPRIVDDVVASWLAYRAAAEGAGGAPGVDRMDGPDGWCERYVHGVEHRAQQRCTGEREQCGWCDSLHPSPSPERTPGQGPAADASPVPGQRPAVDPNCGADPGSLPTPTPVPEAVVTPDPDEDEVGEVGLGGEDVPVGGWGDEWFTTVWAAHHRLLCTPARGGGRSSRRVDTGGSGGAGPRRKEP